MAASHEYRVVPVIRYVVTHHERTEHSGSTSTAGEFDTMDTAHEVAYALAGEKARELDADPDSDTVIFPNLQHTKDTLGTKLEVLTLG